MKNVSMVNFSGCGCGGCGCRYKNSSRGTWLTVNFKSSTLSSADFKAVSGLKWARQCLVVSAVFSLHDGTGRDTSGKTAASAHL